MISPKYQPPIHVLDKELSPAEEGEEIGIGIA